MFDLHKRPRTIRVPEPRRRRDPRPVSSDDPRSQAAASQVAALGDSVVRGDTSHLPREDQESARFGRGNYPQELETLLDCEAANFGASGATAIDDNRQYIKRKQLLAAAPNARASECPRRSRGVAATAANTRVTSRSFAGTKRPSSGGPTSWCSFSA